MPVFIYLKSKNYNNYAIAFYEPKWQLLADKITKYPVLC
jgi:hypothetical protein